MGKVVYLTEAPASGKSMVGSRDFFQLSWGSLCPDKYGEVLITPFAIFQVHRSPDMMFIPHKNKLFDFDARF
jgi:hypothetical protein